MIFQANLEFSFFHGCRVQGQRAGSQGHDLLDEFQQLPDLLRVCKGAEVFRSVVEFFSGEENARERFFFDHDPGIGLVVFQPDVVPRLKFLDQTVLQVKGILFGIDGGELDPFDSFDQFTGLL